MSKILIHKHGFKYVIFSVWILMRKWKKFDRRFLFFNADLGKCFQLVTFEKTTHSDTHLLVICCVDFLLELSVLRRTALGADRLRDWRLRILYNGKMTKIKIVQEKNALSSILPLSTSQIAAEYLFYWFLIRCSTSVTDWENAMTFLLIIIFRTPYVVIQIDCWPSGINISRVKSTHLSISNIDLYFIWIRCDFLRKLPISLFRWVPNRR